MKQLLTTIALVFAAFCCSYAQPNPSDFFVQGYVYDQSTGGAVNGQTVCVYADSSNGQNFSFYECTTTNANGYYYINVPGGSITGPNIEFHVYTLDCQQNSLDTLINNGQGTVDQAWKDWYVCTNTTNQCDPTFAWGTVPGTTAYLFSANGDPNSGINYVWDFGDGSTGTGQNPTHSYNSTGPFYVCLTVSNTFLGCTATSCDTVGTNMGSGCDSYFYSYLDSINYLTQNFYGSSNSNVTSWFWDFGDGNYSTLQNPSHTYQDTGWYNVCLTVNNCNSAYCEYVYISDVNTGNCSAYFLWNTTTNPNGMFGYQFSYAGLQQNGISFFWEFGDGTTSTQQNPIHYYAYDSTYTVCLTITEGNCTNTYCEVVGDNNTGGCQAYFSPMDSSGTFFFYDLSSGNISYWLWDFGDGTTSNQQYPSHQYSSPGVYTVCLQVGDFFNTCGDTYCETVVVDTNNTNPCQVWFQYFTVPGGATVFSAYGGSNNTTVYTWSFGNGTGGTGQTISQVLPAGTYNVCLTAVDPATGCQSTYCAVVVIGGNNTFDYCISGQVSLGTPNLPADVAIVYLITYDPQTNLLVAVQATTVDSSGWYSFCQVPAGQYLIKAALTQNSAYYWNFLPTYYGNSLFWNYAAQVNVSANTSGVDIWLIAGANQGGPGFVGGDVTQGANKTEGPGDPLADVQVMLLDMNNYPVAYTYSNSQGHFEFDGVPYGTYQVWAEVAGLLTTPAIITISAQEPTIDNIGIIVNETQVTTGISPLVEAAKLGFGNVFPNPSANEMFIQVSSEANLQLNFSIYDVAGRMADSRLVTIPSGKTQVALQTTNLSAGIYTLNIQSTDGSLKISKKLVKTE
jgi:PKD repeat protein